MRRFRWLVRPILDFLHLPHHAFEDVTVESCRRFNEETPDAPGVRYFSVTGGFRGGWWAPRWWLPARIVERAEGPNDGIVSVRSATWGEDCDVWDADHLELINWPWPLAARSRGEERIAGYVRLVRRLADEGF